MAVKVHKSGYGKWKIPVIIIAVILIICAVGGGILLKDSMGVSIPQGEVQIEVSAGDGMAAIADKLERVGAVKYPILFKIQSVLGGYDEHYQSGYAIIKDGMSYHQILNLLVTPSREATKITIPEGYEVRQIAQKLDEAGVCSWQDFYAALNPADYDYDFLKNLPARDGQLEGYLFPATYEIPKDMSAHDIVDLMIAAFDNQFAPEYRVRCAELGMSIDQLVTMASIIEREAGDGEMSKVSGVFYNRKNAKMKIQSCATIQYILRERKPVLSISDTRIDSPYNTYLYPGLPIGPICNPGINSIHAALYPETTDAYYFVLGKDGSHIFSRTYEEHLAAMGATDTSTSVDSSAIENQDNLK